MSDVNIMPAASSAIEITSKGLSYCAAHEKAGLRKEASEIIEGCLDLVERMLRVLDRLDPDPDLEPNGDDADVSWPEGFRPFDTSLSEDAEDDDPAGGDVLDEPHDKMDEGNDEPNLGWSEKCSQGRDKWEKNPGWTQSVDPDDDVVYGQVNHLEFDGNGHHDGNDLLRQHGLPTVRVTPGVGRGW